MGTAALCGSVRLIRIQRAVGAIKTRQLSCFEWILVSNYAAMNPKKLAKWCWNRPALSHVLRFLPFYTRTPVLAS